MAENQEDRSTEDLSEEASQYRLEEYRRKGQVSQSREVSGLAALLAAGATAYALSPNMGQHLAEFMRESFRVDLVSRFDLDTADVGRALFIKAIKLMGWLGLPICLAGFAMGAFSSFAQIGSIFSTDPLTPKLEKIDPIQGLKRLFSMKQGIEAIRLSLKVAVVFFVAYLMLKGQVFKSTSYLVSEPVSLFLGFAQAAKGIFLPLITILGVFAAIDFALQRREYMKNLRLTKQEAKQEHKEKEGDPQIKARIRAIQRDMARKRMMDAVKKADVVITNPTHFAIALVYDRKSMAAPKVVAKGADFLAQRIKKVAADAGVPMVENVPLARTLYKTVKVGQYVPRALYQAVAEVLAYVYRLKKKDFV